MGEEARRRDGGDDDRRAVSAREDILSDGGKEGLVRKTEKVEMYRV